MPTSEADATLGQWILKGQEQTGFIMQTGLARYVGTDGHMYELEVADKEMPDGGLTGWTYRVIKGGNKVPMGFWRIYGDGRIHTRPAFWKD